MRRGAPTAVEIPTRRPRFQRAWLAFAQRDWLGIAIEIAIVTLGVLLAFRAEEWGRHSARAAEEREFLNRLHQENADSIRELRDLGERHGRAIEQLTSAILKKDDPATLQRFARIEGFGCWMMLVPGSSHSDTASAELLASGKLSLISNPSLRSNVRGLAVAQANSAAVVSFSRQVAQVFTPYLHAYHDLTLTPDQRTVCYVDWPAVMRDREAANAAVRTYRSHRLVWRNRQALLKRSRQVQGALSCELEKPECRQ